MDDLVKLENRMSTKEDPKGMDTKQDLKRIPSKEDLKRMASKEDLKGMARKEYLQDLKELMKDIENRFIPHVSTQEYDKEKKYDLFQSRLEKIKKQLENRKFEYSKVDDSL